MANKLTLSVIVITKNEEDRLARCLRSVTGLANELIVFDSGSTDSTVSIARQFTDRVFVTDWQGYGVQKQRALDKTTCDWVLSIDADEELSAELQQEIANLLVSDPVENVFKIPWAVMIFDKRLNYGRSAKHVRRLFKREGAKFTTDIVHEKIRVPKGKVGKLRGRLNHYSIRDFEHYLTKNRTYAWLGAKKRYEKKQYGGGLWGASFRAAWVFIHIYFLRGGILDGSVGFLVAVMYSQSAFNKYAGLWTLHRKDRFNSIEKQCVNDKG